MTPTPDYDDLPDTKPEAPMCMNCKGAKIIELPPTKLADHRAVRCPVCGGTGLLQQKSGVRKTLKT
jgi:DNA-directed RNA polymerase subunit RPC12/RpoP